MSAPIVRRRKDPGELYQSPHRQRAQCARCRDVAPIAARRLCSACWLACKGNGTLAEYPRVRVRYSLAELVEEYTFLRSGGSSDETIAARLGLRRVRYLRERIAVARERGLLDGPS